MVAALETPLGFQGSALPVINELKKKKPISIR